MKETEILRGLGKARTKQNAKRNSFADGLVQQQNAAIQARYARPAPTGLQAGVESVMARLFGDAPKVLPPSAPSTPAAAAQPPMTDSASPDIDMTLNTRAAQDKALNTYARGTPFVHGPGTGISDSVPAHLSAGEAVLPAKTVARVGPQNIARLIQQTNDGIAPKTGLTGAHHFADGTVPVSGQFDTVKLAANPVPPKPTGLRFGAGQTMPLLPTEVAAKNKFADGLVPDTAIPKASNLSMDPNVDYDTPPGARGVQSSIPAPEGAPATPAAEPVAAQPRSLMGDLSRAKNYVTGGPSSAAPAAAESSVPAVAKEGFASAAKNVIGKLVGVGAGLYGGLKATKNIVDNGVGADNATDLAGNAALVGGSLASAPVAVGAGSFLAGKELGKAGMNYAFGDAARRYGEAGSTGTNWGEVNKIAAANPNGQLSQYLARQNGGTPDVATAAVQPGAGAAQPDAASVSTHPAWQPGQMNQSDVASTNRGLRDGSIYAGEGAANTLQPGTGYITRSDGTAGTRVGGGQVLQPQTMRSAAQPQDATSQQQSVLDEARAALSNPNATRAEKDRASATMNSVLTNQNALDVANMNYKRAMVTVMPDQIRAAQSAAEASEKHADDQTANIIPKEVPGPDGKMVPNPEYSRFTGDARFTVGRLADKALADGDPAEIAKWYDSQTKQAKAFGQLDDASRSDLHRMALNRARVEQSYNRLGSRALLGNTHSASRDLTDYDLTKWNWDKAGKHAVSPNGKSSVRRDDLKSTELGNYILPEWAKDPTSDFTSQVGTAGIARSNNTMRSAARPRQFAYGIDPHNGNQ